LARDEKIVIRLTEDVKNRFQEIAERYGLTISALGSYVIGEYVAKVENNTRMQEKILGKMVDEMKGMFIQEAEKSLEFAGVLEMIAGTVKKQVESQNRP
jgi:antitoxin component of RelBE/YafQ-DinJ toxin-antitoxin module